VAAPGGAITTRKQETAWPAHPQPVLGEVLAQGADEVDRAATEVAHLLTGDDLSGSVVGRVVDVSRWKAVIVRIPIGVPAPNPACVGGVKEKRGEDRPPSGGGATAHVAGNRRCGVVAPSIGRSWNAERIADEIVDGAIAVQRPVTHGLDRSR
jgi:hypothetical protein